jgi:hypothetical protein
MNSSRRVFSRLAILLCAAAISSNAFALRSTKAESFTDPDYKNYRPKKVVVVVLNAPNDTRKIIEDRLTDQLADYGVEAVKEREIFPPTREWTADARAEILAANGIDSVLMVAIGANSSSVRTVGRQTFGSTSVSGNVNATSTVTSPNTVNTRGTYNGTANSNSTSYDIVVARSKADFSAVLMDVATSRTAWYADVTTKASGTLFVGDKGDAKGAVKGVIDALEDDGHLSKRKK